MELLTGKALADFNMWLLKEGNETIVNGTVEYYLYYMCKYMIPDCMVYTKVIEWLDSVEVYIMIGRYGYSINVDDVGSWNRKVSGCRFDITQQAIIHANKIYNER